MSPIASTPIDAEAKNAPTSGRLFFLDLGAGCILSVNPDGSDLKTIINEEIGRPDHLRLVSNSDVFTPTGRTKIEVIWDLSVKTIDDGPREFTNTVHTSATPELINFLGKQGIPLEVFRSARKPLSEAHNQQETPLFASSIEQHALRRK